MLKGWWWWRIKAFGDFNHYMSIFKTTECYAVYEMIWLHQSHTHASIEWVRSEHRVQVHLVAILAI